MSSYVIMSEAKLQPDAIVSRTLVNSDWHPEVHSRARDAESRRGLSTETLPNNDGQVVNVVLRAVEQAALMPG